MTKLEHGELRVVVPVGFLLAEEQEVSLSVDRPDGSPLPIRLRLIPARQSESAAITIGDPTPAIGWPARRDASSAKPEDGYPTPEYGGSD